MFKKIILAIALALPMFASAQSAPKNGVVEVSTIVQAMPEYTDAQNKLAEASKKYETAYQSLGEEFKKLAEEFQNLKADELPAIRENKARDLQDKQNKIEQFERQAQEDLQRQQQTLMAPIMDKVRTAIEAIGKEEGYSTISEKQSYIYVGNDIVDITPKVKARLGLK